MLALAEKLKAPVGYSFRGKQWLESENPYAVGMTGLLGYGGAYNAIHKADLLLLLGTDFPFSEFLPGDGVKKVQVDRRPKHIGRRTPIDLPLVGDVKATLTALLPKVRERAKRTFSTTILPKRATSTTCSITTSTRVRASSPSGRNFWRRRSADLASQDAMFFADTGTPCIWLARHIRGGTNRRFHGSLTWASMANAAGNAFGAQLAYPGRQTIALCGDGGFTMLGLGDLLTQVERKTNVLHIIFNNESLNFVDIEQQEAGIVPFGVNFKNPNFARVAEAMGAKGIRLEEPGDVKDALAEALAYKDGPMVVDAVVDRLRSRCRRMCRSIPRRASP